MIVEVTTLCRGLHWRRTAVLMARGVDAHGAGTTEVVGRHPVSWDVSSWFCSSDTGH